MTSIHLELLLIHNSQACIVHILIRDICYCFRHCFITALNFWHVQISHSLAYSQLKKKKMTTEEALCSIVLNPDQIDSELLWLFIQTTPGLFSFPPLWLSFLCQWQKAVHFSTSWIPNLALLWTIPSTFSFCSDLHTLFKEWYKYQEFIA